MPYSTRSIIEIFFATLDGLHGSCEEACGDRGMEVRLLRETYGTGEEVCKLQDSKDQSPP